MIGTGMAARRGVLIKSGDALETFPRVDCILFDKTGTLTEGRLVVTDLRPLGSAPPAPEELLRLVASAEAGSEHPIARAILAAARDRALPTAPVEEFHATPGRGLACKVEVLALTFYLDLSRSLYLSLFSTHVIADAAWRGLAQSRQGRSLLVGTRAWLVENGVPPLEPLAEAALCELEAQGKTVILAAADGKLLGALAVADVLKEETRAVLAQLREEGVELRMISGDNARTARAVAAQAGLLPDEVCAETLPQDKAERVREMRQRGYVVAFVGDGVNDAVALAEADLGVAIGAGTEVALETADVVLVRSRLDDVLVARDLVRCSYLPPSCLAVPCDRCVRVCVRVRRAADRTAPRRGRRTGGSG